MQQTRETEGADTQDWWGGQRRKQACDPWVNLKQQAGINKAKKEATEGITQVKH